MRIAIVCQERSVRDILVGSLSTRPGWQLSAYEPSTTALLDAIRDGHEMVLVDASGLSRQRLAAQDLLHKRLSDRERDVLRLAVTGAGNKEVADRLAISEATVKVHLTRIFQKLGVTGRTALAVTLHEAARYDQRRTLIV